MNNTTNKEHPLLEDMSLRDLRNVILAHKKLLVALPLLLTIGASFLVSVLPPEWQSTSVIQIGQVWQVALGQVWQVALPIEPPARAIERMKLRPFQNDVLASLGLPTNEENRLVMQFTSSLAVRVLPNTDLLELRLRAYSREEARRWAEATVKHLQDAHQKLADPLIARLRQQLDEIKKQMQSLREQRDGLLKNADLRADIGPGNRFAENLLLSNFLLQKDAELRSFDFQRLALEEQLNPAKTYPTSLIEKVYVPEKQAYPKKVLTILIAAFAGFLIAVASAFLMNFFRGNTLNRP
jgi:hypothetical protein